VTRDYQSMSFPSPPPRCGHPRHCGATPDGVEPCSHMTSPHQSLYNPSTPVSETLRSMCGQQPCANAGQITLEAALMQVQKPTRHPQGRFARTSIKQQALHAGTMSPMQTTLWHVCKPPPLGL
jgi:hypothetical protein